MLTIYTNSSNAAYQKAVSWLTNEKIPFLTHFIRRDPLTMKELKELVKLTENGLDDITSIRSQKYNSLKDTLETYSFNDLLNELIKTPILIRTPIITDGKKFLIGYQEAEIRKFIPKKRRRSFLQSYYISPHNLDEIMQ